MDPRVPRDPGSTTIAGPVATLRDTVDGCEIHAGVVDPAVCDRLLEYLAPQLRPQRAGARHLLRNPAIAAFAQTPVLQALADRALGAEAVPFRATLFAKTARANWLVAWHQDTALPFAARVEAPGFGPWSHKDGVPYAHAPTWLLQRVVALRVHLDASTADNGPLRVIAGSHRLGVLSDPEVAAIARGAAPTTCVVGRGGVLAMSPLLIHASSKALGDAPRRVLHLEYADSLQPAPGVDLAVT
jgi:ectoine hydroxylase-related dioxygenase (phytanoyl-CoA dioxygenase family)